jgi:hypothetical protein
MNTCLVVDDMENRHQGFEKILGGKVRLLRAYNCTEAAAWVREVMFDERSKIDTIFLDHDIDSPTDSRDVLHFVNWLMDNVWIKNTLKNWETNFFIHSHNPIGADNMRHTLEFHGFPVKVKRFEAQ